MPLSTATTTVMDAAGTPVSGATLRYRLVKPPVGDGSVYDMREQVTPASNASGVITVSLQQSAEYAFWYGATGPKVKVVTPAAATMTLPQIRGAATP